MTNLRRGLALCWVLVAPIAIAENPIVEMHTTEGLIVLELDEKNAPISVRNFLRYVDLDGYEGAIFHRVIPEFMIQTGGHYESLVEMEELEPIRNEATNGLSNRFGTIALARTEDIDSATRQFFINTRDNYHLDHSSESCTREEQLKVSKAAERGLIRPTTCRTFGYAVFGRVIDGFDVIKKIEQIPTASKGDHDDLPVEAITVDSIKRRDSQTDQ